MKLPSVVHCFALALVASCTVTLYGCGGGGGDPPAPTPAPRPQMPSVKLRNKVEMPMLSAGTWLYNDSVAEAAVEAAISVGFTHIDTAYDYKNQRGVAAGIKKSGIDRKKLFLTTKVPGCGLQNVSAVSVDACANDTKTRLHEDLTLLQTQYIDLILLHFPPCAGDDGTKQSTKDSTCFAPKTGCTQPQTCDMVKAQWGVLMDAYSSGLVRAIGVSNYCKACFACLQGSKVQPMVNQVQFHAGMGSDPQGSRTFAEKNGVALQAWSPLGTGGSGSSDILHGKLTSSIGKKHGKSPVQVALKWILSHNVSIATKSSSKTHLAQDIDLFDFELDEDDMSQLDKATFSSKDTPSFMCSDAAETFIENLVV